MSTNEQVLERLDRLEKRLKPLLESNARMQELKADLSPLANQATGILINELLEVESSFEMEDLIQLIKQLMRSVKNLTSVLGQLDNLIEFLKDIEPLLHTAVPRFIEKLDDMEKRGIFRIVRSTLDIRAKVAAAYDHEDIDKIGDGIVTLLGVAQKLSDPNVADFMNRLIEAQGNFDRTQCQPIGPGKLISSLMNKEVQMGFGVMLELTKAMGKITANKS